jgi:hypothetical protein
MPWPLQEQFAHFHVSGIPETWKRAVDSSDWVIEPPSGSLVAGNGTEINHDGLGSDTSNRLKLEKSRMSRVFFRKRAFPIDGEQDTTPDTGNPPSEQKVPAGERTSRITQYENLTPYTNGSTA